MTSLMNPQTVLTASDAANQLQAKQLDALGLVAPNISSVWSTISPTAGDVDAANLRLRLNAPLAPFRGLLRLLATPADYSDVAGDAITSPAAVLTLHPEAAHRLARLVQVRLGAPLNRPLPVAMLVHGVTLPTPLPAINWLHAGATMGLAPAGPLAVSFHDARGLPIDPLAVAALFLDLITWRPALRLGDTSSATPMPAANAPGGLSGIVALATAAKRCHVIDPHGRAFKAPRAAARLKLINGAAAEVGVVPYSGLVDVAAGQRLGRSTADDAAETAALAGTQQRPALHWGLAINGTLAHAPLTLPDVPAGVTLATQFFRVMAVDLDWHLLGNRSGSTIDGIPPDDQVAPFIARPLVRTAVPAFDYLIDGQDVLGAISQAAAGFPTPGADVKVLICSPQIDATTALPPGPGVAGHWPGFPGPVTTGTLPANADATAGLTAAIRAPADAPNARLDVIVTIAADAVPPGTHLRVFPRSFVEINAIGAEASFVRGDGGASVAVAGQPSATLLINPYNLANAAPLPTPARLLVDVVATAPDSKRRLHSGVELTINPVPQPWVGNAARFGGNAVLQTPALAALLAVVGSTAVAPASLFGIAPVPPPGGGAGGSIVQLVRKLANETTAPRNGPRLPTQGRFDTVVAFGTAPAAGQPLAFKAVLSGARYTAESRSAQPELGDPGNPAGPDVHAAGIRADGQLAHDLAVHALKRAQSVLPMGPAQPGWLLTMAGNNWSDPAPDASGTVAAAMLETIAPFCDSPELGLPGIPVLQAGDTLQAAADALADALNVPRVAVNLANEARLRRALTREMITAKKGQRDALFALTRAISQAREFVYIESPSFAPTARPAGVPQPHEIDLVELLRARLQANPRLKVMLAVPRNGDFATTKANWVRAALQHRKAAITTLTTQDRQRVAAFHPIGFPGRPALMRSTVVIVDDVWALVGSSHFRRRGMTFDGGCDVVSIDRALNTRGSSAAIARFRQELMAGKLGVPVPGGPASTTALWTRLAEPESAFSLLAELLAAGGLGRCSPVWAGPSDNRVIAQSDAIADPDGVDADGSGLLALFGTLLLDA